MTHEQEPTLQQVSAMFVKKYYNTLLGNTEHLFKFYKDDSTSLHAEYNETGIAIMGHKAIEAMFETMDFKNARIKLQFVDAQRSLNGSIFVITSGTLSTSTSSREFTQGFVLAAQQPKGYYVLNDFFRYMTPLDGPDAKKSYPTVNFGTFGSHGPASPTPPSQKATPSVIPHHVVSDEQLSEADSTAATAGGSFATADDMTSRAGLNEEFPKDDGHTGPRTISSVGSISSEQEESVEEIVSVADGAESLNGPITEESPKDVEQQDVTPVEHRLERSVSGRRDERRQHQKKDGKGKKQKYEEEVPSTKEEVKQEEIEQKPKEAPKPVENPTSWAHAVFGSTYEPPTQPINVPKGDGKRERKSKGFRSDRTTKKSENTTAVNNKNKNNNKNNNNNNSNNNKISEKHKQKREGPSRYQNSIYVSKLDSSTTSETLKQTFGQFGTVTELKTRSGKDGSIAFVFFDNREAVDKTLGMNGKLTIDGVVPMVQKRKNRERAGQNERKENKESKIEKEESGSKKGDDKDSESGWTPYRGKSGRPRARGNKSQNGHHNPKVSNSTGNNTNTRA